MPVKTISAMNLKQVYAIFDYFPFEISNSRGEIIYANEKFCRLSGYTIEELINQNHRIFNSNFHSKLFFDQMKEKIFSGKFWQGEIKNVKKNGDFFWVETVIFPILDNDDKILNFVSLRIDISAKKELVDVVNKLEELASIGELAEKVAHEINNPLAVIDICLSNLEKEINKNSYTKEYLTRKVFKIRNASKRIANFVNELKRIKKNKK